MAVFTVERQDAPELAAKLALSNPPAYTVFQEVLPFAAVREKAGTLTFMQAADVSATGAATENRTETTALDEEAVATGSVEYTLGLFEKRAYVAEREESNYGTADNVKNAGGTTLAAKFFRAIESKFVSYLTAAGDAVAMTEGNIVSAIQEAVDDVYVYGAPVLVLTRKALRALRKSEEIKELLFSAGKAANQVNYILGTPDAFKEALKDLLEINKVIVADSNIWGSTYDNQIFVTAVRPEMLGKPTDTIDTVKAAPCAGVIAYVPIAGAAADPFCCARITTWFDNKAKRNELDADGTLAILGLDKNAIKRFSLPA